MFMNSSPITINKFRNFLNVLFFYMLYRCYVDGKYIWKQISENNNVTISEYLVFFVGIITIFYIIYIEISIRKNGENVR